MAGRPSRVKPADRIRELVTGWSRRAQLTVVHRGETIIDLAHGCSPDALFWQFSASKPFATVIALQLAEAGRLDLDAPVSEYWAEFAAGGKGEITLRQVLQHRTGVATAGSALGDVLAMTDPTRMVARIERATPKHDPAEGSAYQYLVYGAIIAEVARRVTGRGYRHLVFERILEPLGMRGTYLGLDAELLPGAVPLRAAWWGQAATRYLNSERVRGAVIPSAGVSTSARELAVFYSALLADLRGAGRLLSAATLEAAITATNDGDLDLFLGRPVRWGSGFQLGGTLGDPNLDAPFGELSSPRAFGHNGSFVCLAWADPDRDLVVASCTDRIPTRTAGRRHSSELSDAIVAFADAR